MGKKKAAFLLIGWGLIADSSSQINVERSQLFQHGGGGTGQKTAKDVSEWGQAQYGQPMQKKRKKITVQRNLQSGLKVHCEPPKATPTGYNLYRSKCFYSRKNDH
jgi:hypothetical protein